MPFEDQQRRARAGLKIRGKQLGLSDAEIARQLRVSRTTVGRWTRVGVNLESHREQIHQGYGYYSEDIVTTAVLNRYRECRHSVHAVPMDDFAVTAHGKPGVETRLARGALHNATMEPMLLVLKPGDSTSDSPTPHKGEEILILLSGTVSLEYRSDSEETHELRLDPGLLVQFDSSTPHRLVNDSEGEARVLLIKAPPDRYSECRLDSVKDDPAG